ncbi:alanine--tRNA ligase [Sulfuritalea hydrogenivorans]|uniref:Alanine--tRNA ligase n=1 Tax=Sulfuritalea hydrogenivorans sk43H TaxID=1223802 RepID=W0SCX3_9PROT|nr:alanine--tRNA ligase [Sulfuritalea hydrogenivorans]BAO28610.1 alanyl-tRNA synthetase [Sulfuritalea hydrogenivorans sk43H]
MKSSEIRQAFLDFFASKGHQVVASSSLVPHEDPTLLFTNAGMNQFKDVFLGFDKRSYTRAASSQKCVRAGGKHNDLENVGYTARHHTFFEMLGNFSFGDYFKRDAIKYAWELLVDVFKLPADKLWVTVYAEDDEAYDIWTKEIGVPQDRVIRIGDNKGARYASDNFWMMGDTGPCGPCTEIFYDHGEHIWGGPPGSEDEDGDRYIEIWNNVFMQFNRDEAGIMHPLPKPSVDTGMGLERISAVLQHVHANYEIDLFQALIAAAARETSGADMDSPSLRVLADHIRACSFLIADGVIPGNEGRGYVLRRIIRRAIRHGWKLGARSAFFHKMVPDLVTEMGAAYPELASGKQRVMDVLKQEEDRFFATIEHGMAILEAELELMEKTGVMQFNGETAFKLHDTYGFPLDLTADICRERQIVVDSAAFDAAMTRQKEQARAAGKFKMAANLDYDGPATTFHGYETLEAKGNILALYKDGTAVNELVEGELGVVVLDDTPFYAESGGQVGDVGELRSVHGIFAVEDTQKIQASVFGHHGVVRTGTLKVGGGVTAKVDTLARARTIRHHSATHLMHKALREVLGPHVQQKGSQVDPDKTRFDFAHTQPVTAEEILRIERIVNDEVIANAATDASVMDLESAQKTGAMMLFGEKYGDEVRVLTIGSSKELCGGTHVARTGDIGLFKIVMEAGVAAGVRRIEAVCGDVAVAKVQQQQALLDAVAAELKAQPAEAAARVAQIQDNVKALEKELARLKSKLAASQGDDLLSQAVDVKGVKVLAAILEGADATALRETLDKLKDKLKSAAIVLASTGEGKVSLIAGVTADLTSKLKAGELVNFVAQQVGGKGGGRPDMAQAGGTQPAAVPAALASVKGWVEARL